MAEVSAPHRLRGTWVDRRKALSRQPALPQGPARTARLAARSRIRRGSARNPDQDRETRDPTRSPRVATAASVVLVERRARARSRARERGKRPRRGVRRRARGALRRGRHAMRRRRREALSRSRSVRDARRPGRCVGTAAPTAAFSGRVGDRGGWRRRKDPKVRCLSPGLTSDRASAENVRRGTYRLVSIDLFSKTIYVNMCIADCVNRGTFRAKNPDLGQFNL